jgi:hypothetical protein
VLATGRARSRFISVFNVQKPNCALNRLKCGDSPGGLEWNSLILQCGSISRR